MLKTFDYLALKISLKKSCLRLPSILVVILLANTALSAPKDQPQQSLKQPHAIQDLAYGDFLFDYFQSNHFSAISKAMVANRKNQLQYHNDSMQVLLASLYADYGMLDDAKQLYSQTLKQSTSENTQHNAWYHLAKLNFEQGQFKESNAIINRYLSEPQNSLQDSLKDKVNLLKAQNLIQSGHHIDAIEQAQKIQDIERLSPYARYNLASLQSFLNQKVDALPLFKDIIEFEQAGALTQSIKDKAALALGKLYLQEKQWKNARKSFETIHLDSESSNEALLGLGWSYLKDNDPVGALTPWQTLREKNAADPAVQEVFLGLPQVYEAAGALQEALDGYRSANTFYLEQQASIETIKGRINNVDWFNTLVAQNDLSLNPLDDIPAFSMPSEEASLSLHSFYASHVFNAAYENYLELQRLQRLLKHWKQQTPIFDAMIATNADRLADLSPRLDDTLAHAEKQFGHGRQTHSDLSIKLTHAIKDDDLIVTANDKEITTLDRLNFLRKAIKQLPDTDNYRQIRQQFYVLEGTFMWNLNETVIARRWEHTKELRFIENQLSILEANIKKIMHARQQRFKHFDGFRNRVTALRSRLDNLEHALSDALTIQQNHIQAITINMLESNQKRINNLQANALFSIARLQDMAYMKHEINSIQDSTIENVKNE